MLNRPSRAVLYGGLILHTVLSAGSYLCGKSALRGNYLKPSMTILDLTASARPSAFIREALARGCAVVPELAKICQPRCSQRLSSSAV